MSYGEALIIVSEPVCAGGRSNMVGKVRAHGHIPKYPFKDHYIKERTGMSRLLKLIRLLKGWDYSVVWDFTGEHAIARVKWPDDPRRGQPDEHGWWDTRTNQWVAANKEV